MAVRPKRANHRYRKNRRPDRPHGGHRGVVPVGHYGSLRLEGIDDPLAVRSPHQGGIDVGSGLDRAEIDPLSHREIHSHCGPAE
jgi:hypothetical protein